MLTYIKNQISGKLRYKAKLRYRNNAKTSVKLCTEMEYLKAEIALEQNSFKKDFIRKRLDLVMYRLNKIWDKQIEDFAI